MKKLISTIKYFFLHPDINFKQFFIDMTLEKTSIFSYHDFLGYYSHLTHLNRHEALLLYCADRGNLKAVQFLVSKKINPHFLPVSPLSMASYKGHLPVVLYLSQFITKNSKEYEESLKWSYQGRNSSVIRYFIESF